MNKMILYNLLCFLFLISCVHDENSNTNSPTNETTVYITTDKACYNPGDVVTFTIDKNLSTPAKIRYRHLSETIQEDYLSGQTWSWSAPAADFTGYLVDIYEMSGDKEYIYGSIAVDVSSDWARFPRYGFLSEFPGMTEQQINNKIDTLTRYHLNGLMFYDFENKHHKPLAGTPDNPENVWKDIALRDIYLTTVQRYITKAHENNMMAMFYNLAYGAWKNASSEGVSDNWYMYTNQSHTTIDYVYLDENWSSSIFLLDPSNTGWQNYIAKQNEDLYSVFDFDGYHVDQLGNRDKTLYSHSGAVIDLPTTFAPFLDAMKLQSPNKKLVMNAVDQYGQEGIATTDVDFMYTEVWSPTTYAELAEVITNNNSYTNNTKNTVLAAYMNKGLSDVSGYFNMPGVLLAESVIFAFGGSHIELGEHMLVHEYFPNSNRKMSVALQKSIVTYYDFLVAYENLLRDGGIFNSPTVSCTDRQMTVNSWPPRSGNVASIGKLIDNRQVIHLINFTNANDLTWRDNLGTQNLPAMYQNFALDINVTGTVNKIWYASPDYNHGSPEILSFTQTGNAIAITVPGMQYWGMIVVEYR